MTAERATLAGNAARNFAILFLSGVVSLATTVIVGRTLIPAEVGRVALASAVATLGSGLPIIGLGPAITRVVAERRPEPAAVSAVVRYSLRQCAFGIACEAAVIGGVLAMHVTVTGNVATDVVAAIGAASGAIAGVASAVAMGFRDFKTLVRVAYLSQPTALLATVIVAIAHPTATAFVIAQVSGLAVGAVGLAPLCMRHAEHKPDFVSQVRGEIRRQRVQLAQLAIADLVVFQRSEILILGLVSTRSQVAFYGLAYNLVSQAMARLPGSLSGVLLPEIAGTSGAERAATFRTASVFIAMLTMILVIPGIAAPNAGAQLLFGVSYRSVGDVIRILILGGAATALASPSAALLLAADQQRTIKRLGFALAAVDVVLAYTLARSIGAVGAALGSSMAQVVGLVAGLVIVQRVVGLSWPREMFVVGAVAAAGLTIAIPANMWVHDPLANIGIAAVVTVFACAIGVVHVGCGNGLCVRCVFDAALASRDAVL